MFPTGPVEVRVREMHAHTTALPTHFVHGGAWIHFPGVPLHHSSAGVGSLWQSAWRD